MVITINRIFFLCFLCLWSTCGSTSGWNDFSRDIGHGFELSKMNSFQVCIGREGHGLLVCPSFDSGDFGPVTAFSFTENHLLVKTLGAKPSIHIPGHYTSDPDRYLFFVIDKHIDNSSFYRPTGPLERAAFQAHPAVPDDIQWQRATRFASDPDADVSWFDFLWLLAVAPAVFGWPVLLFLSPVILLFAVPWMFRRFRRKKTG